jgi:hypothetical protein
MRIDFQRIITNSGQPLTKAQLAREMVAMGIFKNQASAYSIMQRYERGEASSIQYEILEFLMGRFQITLDQILKP